MVEQKSNDRPKIIAAIPAYNEEQFISEVVSKARRYVDEVIVIDYYCSNKFWGKPALAHSLLPKVSSGIFTLASMGYFTTARGLSP